MKSIFGEKDGLLRQAQLHLSNNQFKESENLLLKYSSTFPDHFGQLYLALAIHQQNRTDEALGILQDIVKQNPKEPEVFQYYRALLYFDKNKYDKCISELNKIKSPNHFHVTLKSLAYIFSEFSGNSKEYVNAYNRFKTCNTVSADLQARVLFKLEGYLPVNLTKRAHASSMPSSWKPILFATRRIADKNNKLQELLKQSIKSAESGEFKLATELLEASLQLEINQIEAEKTRLKISEMMLAKLDISLAQVGVGEIAWAYFFTQQFQKGIEFCKPYMQEKENYLTNTNYLDLLDISAYLNFCLGNFSVAESLLHSKIQFEPKESEQAAYFYAACLQHSKKPFEALNAYKNFIFNSLDGYQSYLNYAMKTIAPDLIIKS